MTHLKCVLTHTLYIINCGVFVKEMFNGEEIFIWVTNALILAMVRLLVSKTIRALRAENQTTNGYCIDNILSMVTGSYSDFEQ